MHYKFRMMLKGMLHLASVTALLLFCSALREAQGQSAEIPKFNVLSAKLVKEVKNKQQTWQANGNNFPLQKGLILQVEITFTSEKIEYKLENFQVQYVTKDGVSNWAECIGMASYYKNKVGEWYFRPEAVAAAKTANHIPTDIIMGKSFKGKAGQPDGKAFINLLFSVDEDAEQVSLIYRHPVLRTEPRLIKDSRR